MWLVAIASWQVKISVKIWTWCPPSHPSWRSLGLSWGEIRTHRDRQQADEQLPPAQVAEKAAKCDQATSTPPLAAEQADPTPLSVQDELCPNIEYHENAPSVSMNPSTQSFINQILAGTNDSILNATISTLAPQPPCCQTRSVWNESRRAICSYWGSAGISLQHFEKETKYSSTHCQVWRTERNED